MGMAATETTQDIRALLIDIGNTNLKWAWLSDNRRSPTRSISYRDRSMPALAQALWCDEPPPDRVLVASVAGAQSADALGTWVRDAWKVQPNFIASPDSALGVTNAYRDPAQLGVDRWLTLIAVFDKKLAPACIVDCGTAITLDVIDRAGQHLGGLILPGFEMMRDALLQRTHIPRQQNEYAVTDIFGRDTASAVAAGSVHAVAALIEKVLQETNRRIGEQPALVLTGSDANRLQAVLSEPGTLLPDLVMSGLALLAREKFQ